MKANYLVLFVKAIIFALIILALNTFFKGIAKAEDVYGTNDPCGMYVALEYVRCQIKMDELAKKNKSTKTDVPYVPRHYSEPPSLIQYSSPSPFTKPQTHYSGVIHGPNIGDWYTFDVVGD